MAMGSIQAYNTDPFGCCRTSRAMCCCVYGCEGHSRYRAHPLVCCCVYGCERKDAKLTCMLLRLKCFMLRSIHTCKADLFAATPAGLRGTDLFAAAPAKPCGTSKHTQLFAAVPAEPRAAEHPHIQS
eukprot:1138504-Pelagomonas_calceolata.AAC.2